MLMVRRRGTTFPFRRVAQGSDRGTSRLILYPRGRPGVIGVVSPSPRCPRYRPTRLAPRPRQSPQKSQGCPTGGRAPAGTCRRRMSHSDVGLDAPEVADDAADPLCTGTAGVGRATTTSNSEVAQTAVTVTRHAAESIHTAGWRSGPSPGRVPAQMDLAFLPTSGSAPWESEAGLSPDATT